MRRLMLFFVSVLLMGGALATDYAKELEKLKASFAADQNAHHAALLAQAQQGKAIDMTSGPAANYIPKAFNLAKRANGDPAAEDALVFAAELGAHARNPDAVARAVEALITENSDSSKLLNASMYIIYSGTPTDKALKLLSRVEHFSNDDETKSGAVMLRVGTFYKGYDGTGDRDRARMVMTRMIGQYPKTKAAARAKAAIFAMDNLVVGATAPDFRATDQDGVAFNLSDYRGKVTVVVFWGFW
ncbi:MAG: peroxiredoxin family protein [Fimbriimonadales bacterium]